MCITPFFSLAIILLLIGCGSNPPVCRRALQLRKHARRAPPEQKRILKAQARGLEEACARERAKLWEKSQQQKRREKEF